MRALELQRHDTVGCHAGLVYRYRSTRSSVTRSLYGLRSSALAAWASPGAGCAGPQRVIVRGENTYFRSIRAVVCLCEACTDTTSMLEPGQPDLRYRLSNREKNGSNRGFPG